MTTIRTVVIDDEPAAVDSITALVQHLARDIEIVATAANGLEAIERILDTKPDLIFLDVDLPMMNGLQVIEKIPHHNAEIIFTTGSSSYALIALKLDAADYLVKPIDPADFLIAIEKVRKRLSVKKLPGGSYGVDRIQLPTQNSIVYLPETEITHVIGMGSYCQIITAEKEKITVSRSIGQIEEKLSKSRFFRCHNSYIINLDFVNRFNTKEGASVILKDSTKVEVSRRNKEVLLQKLAERSK